MRGGSFSRDRASVTTACILRIKLGSYCCHSWPRIASSNCVTRSLLGDSLDISTLRVYNHCFSRITALEVIVNAKRVTFRILRQVYNDNEYQIQLVVYFSLVCLLVCLLLPQGAQRDGHCG